MLRKAFLSVAAVAICLVSLSAFAQRGGAGRGGQTVEKIKMLKPNLYEITGGGANTLVRVTNQGVIVVDTKNPGDENFNRVMEEIKSVTSQPVKFVINTQHHPDHVGNNQKFIDAGAQVVALEALKKWMGDDPRTKDIPGRPTQTFAKDYTLKLADAEVRLYSFGRGHSGGDTMVYFPDAKIVMVSDQITDGTPVIGCITTSSTCSCAACDGSWASVEAAPSRARPARARLRRPPGGHASRRAGVPGEIRHSREARIGCDQRRSDEGATGIASQNGRPGMAIPAERLRRSLRRTIENEVVTERQRQEDQMPMAFGLRVFVVPKLRDFPVRNIPAEDDHRDPENDRTHCDEFGKSRSVLARSHDLQRPKRAGAIEEEQVCSPN